MTPAIAPCAAPLFLRDALGRVAGRWLVPDRAASCGDESTLQEPESSFWGLLRDFLLGRSDRLVTGAEEFEFPHPVIRWCAGRMWISARAYEPDWPWSPCSWHVELFSEWLPCAPRLVPGRALAARNAAIEGDAAAVDAFARNVLGVRRPEQCREWVVDALLGDWVHQLGRLLADAELLRILHAYVTAERQRWKPVWDHRVLGRRVGLLESPLTATLTLADLAVDPRLPEDSLQAAQPGDGRILPVLRGLTPAEARVARAWAGDPELSWSRAAAAVGEPDPDGAGERVRRKLKRLGRRHGERAAAAKRSG
ncbi:hypothetical protein LG634_02720 [Streptomyces bambusae]|uniref:hypothetical protein n=1 Tax=Streptomyces bambusae TaxID=1550616 RepID=UPI001CFC91F7|nr:hypothetical protein [Streptomyces bambusae]MCB5163758.1 hypothetical protein [Streptomyces bambusae]